MAMTSDTLFTAEAGVSVRAALEDGILYVRLTHEGIIADLYADSAGEDNDQPVATFGNTWTSL